MGLEDLSKIFYKDYIKKNVLVKNVYYHKLSYDEDNDKTHEKYKLIIKKIPELGIYIFFTLNSPDMACQNYTQCIIEQHDYQDKIGKHPDSISYINIKKALIADIDTMTSYHIPPDEFKYLGKIFQYKLDEVLKKCKEIAHSCGVVNDNKKEILLAATGESTEFINKYKL